MTLDTLQEALKLGFKKLKVPTKEKKHVHVEVTQTSVTLSYFIQKVFITVKES